MKLTSQITEMVSAKITQGKWKFWAIMSVEVCIPLFEFILRDMIFTLCSAFSKELQVMSS